MAALHRAIIAGRHGEVLYLLERRNADPNARDELLRTPLIACSFAPREDTALACATALLGKGAQIGLSDRLGKNALCWACTNDKPTLVEAFLLRARTSRSPFDLLNKDRDGNTALHLAAKAGHTGIVELLTRTYAENGLRVCERNYRGETALQLAAKRGSSGAVLSLMPAGSGSLFIRRGGVDFRSSPRWASAAVRVSRNTGESAARHRRPFSVQHTITTPASAAVAQKPRPKTVTSVPFNHARSPSSLAHPGSVQQTEMSPAAKVKGVPSYARISEVFKISEIQLTESSSYRSPARSQLQPTPPSGGEEKNRRAKLPPQKLSGKRRRSSGLTSRSNPPSRRQSVSESDVGPKHQSKNKTIPIVLIDDAKGLDIAVSNGSGRPLGRRESSKPSFFNQIMSDIPESPVDGGRAFLTPYDLDASSRASSLQSLASDLPGLTSYKRSLGRCETAPLVAASTSRPIRRTKSEPSLNYVGTVVGTASPDRNGEPHHRGHKRPRGATQRRRGSSRPRAAADKDKAGSTALGRKHHSKAAPLRLEAPSQEVPHPGEHAPPPALTSPSVRAHKRSPRESEVSTQRRRTELERRIKSIRSDIDRLDKRSKGRKYKSLIPDWVTVSDDSTLEEILATILASRSESTDRLQGSSPDTVSRLSENDGVSSEDLAEMRSNATPVSPSVDRSQSRECGSGYASDAHARSLPGNQDTRYGSTELRARARPQLLRSSPRGDAVTIPPSRPAQAPVYRQSRSVFTSCPSVRHRSGVSPLVLAANAQSSPVYPQLHSAKPSPRASSLTRAATKPSPPTLPTNSPRRLHEEF